MTSRHWLNQSWCPAGNPAEIAIIEILVLTNLIAIEEAEGIEKLRAVHDYGLAEQAQALEKSDTAISAFSPSTSCPPK